MTLVINILLDILNEGLMYALLAMGMYITYSILDFPDQKSNLLLLED